MNEHIKHFQVLTYGIVEDFSQLDHESGRLAEILSRCDLRLNCSNYSGLARLKRALKDFNPQTHKWKARK